MITCHHNKGLTANAFCMECQQIDSDRKITAIQGWLCPRCGDVNAPFTLKCGCRPPSMDSTGAGAFGFLDARQPGSHRCVLGTGAQACTTCGRPMNTSEVE